MERTTEIVTPMAFQFGQWARRRVQPPVRAGRVGGWGMHERGGWDTPGATPGGCGPRTVCAVCPRHACEPLVDSIVYRVLLSARCSAGRIFIGGDPQAAFIAPGFANPPAGMTRMNEGNKPPVGQTVHIWWQQVGWPTGYYRARRTV